MAAAETHAAIHSARAGLIFRTNAHKSGKTSEMRISSTSVQNGGFNVSVS